MKKNLISILLIGILILGLTGCGGDSSVSRKEITWTGSDTDTSTLEIGDLLKIGNEEFYVVSNDGKKLVLLAHYNLKVGNIYNGQTKQGEYTDSDFGYGLQSSEAKGADFTLYDSISYGTIEFSNDDFWNGPHYMEEECSFKTYTKGETCQFVYDSHSSLYSYVEAYKNYLIDELGMPSTIEARLLRFEEAYELGCRNTYCKDSETNAPEWLYETSYWLGSYGGSCLIWNIENSGRMSPFGNLADHIYGVRPVIVLDIN